MTLLQRGIRKQAREDIRILKYESRQLKKEQTAARKSAKRQAKLEKQQIKQQLSEERKKERTANKASNQPPAPGKQKEKAKKKSPWKIIFLLIRLPMVLSTRQTIVM